MTDKKQRDEEWVRQLLDQQLAPLRRRSQELRQRIAELKEENEAARLERFDKRINDLVKEGASYPASFDLALQELEEDDLARRQREAARRDEQIARELDEVEKEALQKAHEESSSETRRSLGLE